MATTGGTILTETIEAGADLSAKQFRFVVLNTSGQLVAVSSAGADADGVLLNKPDAAGKAAEFAFGGIVKVVAGGSITAGDKVQSDAAGEALTAASGDHVLGKALKDADDGDLVEVLLVSKHILA